MERNKKNNKEKDEKNETKAKLRTLLPESTKEP